MTPVIRAIRLLIPDARITLLVASRISVELFRYNADVHECIIFYKRGDHRGFAKFWKLWRRIRACQFDLVLNFQRSNLKAWLLVAAAFPARVLVYHKATGRVVHAVRNHLETVAPLGIDPVAADNRLVLNTGEDAEAYADNLFCSLGFTGKNVVALNPGANHPVNRWNPMNFARLADRLSADNVARVVVIGGQEDSALAGEITGQA
jgi:ADP-heptose:LPS heptosyltransferase